MKKSTVVIASLAAGATLVAGVGAGVIAYSASQNTTAVQSVAEEVAETVPVSPTPAVTDAESAAPTLEETLLYIAEEEKLAHDVYQVLGDMWGAKIFSNIQSSEATHQTNAVSLLASYGLTDPRSSELGVFTNPELQALYDQLIAQGSQSVNEAYKVGVLIEETDIADLQESIALTTDQTVLSTLNKLLAASENHLRAFSRQVA